MIVPLARLIPQSRKPAKIDNDKKYADDIEDDEEDAMVAEARLDE